MLKRRPSSEKKHLTNGVVAGLLFTTVTVASLLSMGAPGDDKTRGCGTGSVQDEVTPSALRMRARYDAFNEITQRRLQESDRLAAAHQEIGDSQLREFRELRRKMLDEEIPVLEKEELEAELVAGASRYVTTDADREAEEASRQVHALEEAARRLIRGEPR